jgi:hypothetical protein
MRRPSRVRLAAHAQQRCHDYTRSEREVADLVLASHERRRRKPREADWLVPGRGLLMAKCHAAGGMHAWLGQRY